MTDNLNIETTTHIFKTRASKVECDPLIRLLYQANLPPVREERECTRERPFTICCKVWSSYSLEQICTFDASFVTHDQSIPDTQSMTDGYLPDLYDITQRLLSYLGGRFRSYYQQHHTPRRSTRRNQIGNSKNNKKQYSKLFKQADHHETSPSLVTSNLVSKIVTTRCPNLLGLIQLLKDLKLRQPYVETNI